MRRAIRLLAFSAIACRGHLPLTLSPSAFAFPVDSLRTEVIRPGVSHHFVYTRRGPWAIHVVDVDRGRCWTAAGLKAEAGAVGRERTSVLARRLSARDDVAAAVNADFFLFTPPGVPVGSYVSGGRLIAGPATQPVIAFDSSGAPWIGVLRATGTATVNGSVFPIAGWNRDVRAGLALFDDAWGQSTDTASAVTEVILGGPPPFRVVAVDTLVAGVAIPRVGAVLRVGRDAPDAMRAAMASLATGQQLAANVALTPIHPREAVGGRPLLVRDSVVLAGLDTAGGASFASSRHPRTAAGIGAAGRRLILVVVDGRQAPYSDGMTLRELADLMLSLGARDALNLDGGGSTTLALPGPDATAAFRIANRPSDPAGERPVGNALAIVKRCGRGNSQ